jgi:hypothetical protein
MIALSLVVAGAMTAGCTAGDSIPESVTPTGSYFGETRDGRLGSLLLKVPSNDDQALLLGSPPFGAIGGTPAWLLEAETVATQSVLPGAILDAQVVSRRETNVLAGGSLENLSTFALPDLHLAGQHAYPDEVSAPGIHTHGSIDMDDDGFDDVVISASGQAFFFSDLDDLSNFTTIPAVSSLHERNGKVVARSGDSVVVVDTESLEPGTPLGGNVLQPTASPGNGRYEFEVTEDDGEVAIVVGNPGATPGHTHIFNASTGQEVLDFVFPEEDGAAPLSLATGDFDGDGANDLVLAVARRVDVNILCVIRGPLLVASGDCDLLLAPTEPDRYTSFGASMLAVDLDNDDIDELLVSDPAFQQGLGRVDVFGLQ